MAPVVLVHSTHDVSIGLLHPDPLELVLQCRACTAHGQLGKNSVNWRLDAHCVARIGADAHPGGHLLPLSAS